MIKITDNDMDMVGDKRLEELVTTKCPNCGRQVHWIHNTSLTESLKCCQNCYPG